MELLNKKIDSFDFDSVVEFSSLGIVENIQIDYKKDFSPKGLSKHLASFSNSRGGVIIIGVEEDEKTGVPIKWEGITADKKFDEMINQMAQNVEPLPDIQIHVTNEKEGKVFVLIRIYEGVETPYYVHNDSCIYVRTGNVTQRFEEIASPEVQKQLFEKRRTAKVARELSQKNANDNFEARLAQEKKTFPSRRQANSSKPKEEQQIFFAGLPGESIALCTIYLSPYYPSREPLANPKQIMDSIHEFRASSGGKDFPQSNFSFHPVPNGIFHFDFDVAGGAIAVQQVFSDGLFYDAYDVLNTRRSDGRPIISIPLIIMRLALVLKSASKFYSQFGYQGSLVGKITVTNCANAVVRKISFDRLFDDDIEIFLPKFEWLLELDTNILSNESSIKDFIIQKIKEICWGFGVEDISDEQIEQFLTSNGVL